MTQEQLKTLIQATYDELEVGQVEEYVNELLIRVKDFYEQA